jgi:hypothetical protein
MKYSIAFASVLAAGFLAASPVRAADITSPMAPELKQTEREGLRGQPVFLGGGHVRRHGCTPTWTLAIS